MTYEWKWRSAEPGPQDFTPERFAEQLRKYMKLDAVRAAMPPPPIYVSRDVFNEWVRLGLIDESGKPLTIEVP